MRELTISGREAGQRLDKYLKKYLDEAPGSFIYKMLRKKNITLNGARAVGDERIAAGDVVRLFLSDETIRGFQRRREELPAPALPGDWILYEDEDLIFVDKPAGLLTQRAEGREASLAEMLAARARVDAGSAVAPVAGSAMAPVADSAVPPVAGSTAQPFADPAAGSAADTFRPSPANRLDRNTSGIVLGGRTMRGLQFLTGALRERSVRKEYLVLVAGSFKGGGQYRVYYKKDERTNRVSLSDEQRPGDGVMLTGIACERRCAEASLLRVELLTGRPHQIRAHLAHLGFPVLGDPKYGDAAVNRAFRARYGVKRQLLHAARVTFPEIEGNFSYLSGRTFESKLPRDMAAVAEALGLLSRAQAGR